jgi:hypothetical protein
VETNPSFAPFELKKINDFGLKIKGIESTEGVGHTFIIVAT